MHLLQTPDDLATAAAALTRIEPRFGLVVERLGLPPLRRAEANLESLLRIVTDQLISLKAGEAIWNRLSRELGGFSPGEVLARTEAELRALGLSGAKARTFHCAAKAFSEDLFKDSPQLSQEELLSRLTALPGVGPWTANIYLLVAFRAADAWPAADIALQTAAQDLLSLDGRPSTRILEQLGEGWRPYRSTAALLLWAHYRSLRRMPQGG